MGLFFKSISICAVVLNFCLQACAGRRSRLSPGDSVLLNQTLVSEQGEFALGFFRSDSSSTNHYVGIWYKKIPRRTVVWVANRETPLTDTSGVLTVTGDGNMAVLDARGRSLWSSNVSNVPSNSYAVLLDTGNFVLCAGDTNAVIWQSFEHPTDTWLLGMPLSFDTRTGTGTRLVSWRDRADPSPGDFSLGTDPETRLQVKIWRGKETWVRGSVWSGQPFVVFRDNSSSPIFVQTIEFIGGRIIYNFTTSKESPAARIVLNSTGVPVVFIWQERQGDWYETPTRIIPCTFYNRCGPNAFCDDNATSLHCKCLEGFVPRDQKDWDLGNFAGGCVRRVPFECHEGDGFLKFQGMKLPDSFRLLRNASLAQCEDECMNNCSCTAYSYLNTSVIGSSSRCLMWTTENLNDLRQYSSSTAAADDLYVRLAASELVNAADTYLSDRKRTVLLTSILPVLAVIGLVLLGIFCYFQTKKLKKQVKRRTMLFEEFKVSDILSNGENAAKLAILDFSTLVAATNNFSNANRLGEGGFGPVYKGRLHQGQEIAVKTLSRGSRQGSEEFKNEVELIAKLQHRNLVRLLGWSAHNNEKMLIYEYMPNKSLDKFIFDPSRKAELDWAKRFNIIQGIAQGLLYLHRHSRLRIIHRDLKTSNILLDGKMNPKISDFGLARIFGEDQTEANTKRVAGTLGYMPPEYAFDGLISEKSDVFGFGVMLLEIITGKRSTGLYPYKQSYNLLGYAWEHWKEERSLELMDSSMGSEFSMLEVLKCIQIALLCVQESASDRPIMPSVLSMLTTENTALPSPKHPAFATERDPVVMESSAQGSLSGSLYGSVSTYSVVIDDAEQLSYSSPS